MIAAAAHISLLLFFSLACASSPSLVPPTHWEPVDKKLLAPSVKEGFFTKSKKAFCPSLNLAIENSVLVSPEEYLRSVQKIQEEDPGRRWRKLGTLTTRAGSAFLTSIDMETPLGNVRLLQAILLREKTAYLLTGAALQEEFPLYQETFLDAFRSFTLE